MKESHENYSSKLQLLGNCFDDNDNTEKVKKKIQILPNWKYLEISNEVITLSLNLVDNQIKLHEK